jgi:hypothetical protein
MRSCIGSFGRSVILEMYNEIRRMMETRETYRTRLVLGPVEAAIAHEGKMGVEV